ncbi:hypothetical protein [Methanohalophilus sp. RSK]|nr:hypothetical protein [Methanohalophilus sp. RSK]
MKDTVEYSLKLNHKKILYTRGTDSRKAKEEFDRKCKQKGVGN